MTYLQLAGVALLVPVALLVVAGVVRRPPRAWWVATAVTVVVLLVLTVVFDSLMIAADLFRYDEGSLVGARVWLTPVEDLAWPVAAGLGMPAVMVLLGGARAARPAPAPLTADADADADGAGR